MKTGLVLGKFSPLHLGHEFLIQCALECCDSVFVIISNTIRYEHYDFRGIRYAIRKLEPDTKRLKIIVDYDPIPDPAPEDLSPEGVALSPEFWKSWIHKLNFLTGSTKIDRVFSCDAYGGVLANKLQAEWIAPDLSRYIVPISASEIRANPLKNWEFMSETMRTQITPLRAVIIGPESSGKSTLATMVGKADKNIVVVPEMGRFLCEVKKDKLGYEDFLTISKLQEAAIDSATRRGPAVVLSDTEAFTTWQYSKEYLGGEGVTAVLAAASPKRWDLIFHLGPDIDFVEEPYRHQRSIVVRREKYQEQEDFFKKGAWAGKYFNIRATNLKVRINAVHALIEEKLKKRMALKK